MVTNLIIIIHTSLLVLLCTHTRTQILLQPFAYIQKIPGKNVRGKLALAFNHWLNIPQEKLQIIGEIVQMLHNSSLL